MDERFTAATPVLDARAADAFGRGHAAGAVHLPPAAWDARAAELPPKDAAFLVVADDADAAGRLAADLRARGFAHAAAAPPPVLAARDETGPSRAVLWRPSPALVAAAPWLPVRGRALEVACGSGRGAAWLAARGLATWGVDLLPDALVRARALVAHLPGPVAPAAFAVADATRPLPFRDGGFDVVCGFRYLDRALFASLARLLAPGGVLVWETFLAEQALYGRPKRPAFLLARGELARLCAAAGLTVVDAREAPEPPGPALASVVARTEPHAP